MLIGKYNVESGNLGTTLTMIGIGVLCVLPSVLKQVNIDLNSLPTKEDICNKLEQDVYSQYNTDEYQVMLTQYIKKCN